MKPLYQDFQWLNNKYTIEKYSTRDISKICKMNNGVTICKWLKKFKIPVRKPSDPNYRSPVNRSLMPYKNYQWLYQKYTVENLSAEKIGKSIGIGGAAIRKWLVRFNILRNNRYVGKNHHKWKDGYSFSSKSGRWYINNLNGKKVPRYRFFVEQLLNRKLLSSETIHHINGNRTDDRLENLYLFSSEEKHQTYHQNLIHLILSNIHNNYIDLSKTTFKLIKKSNLSNLSKNE